MDSKPFSEIVLSYIQTEPLLKAKDAGLRAFSISTDLGITETEAILQSDDVIFTDDLCASWRAIEHITKQENSCFYLREGEPVPIQSYSKILDCFYSLYPTESAPTLLISGIPMHRIKDTNPHQDTMNKIKAIAPIRGRILDTATGLGYTAIAAAQTADYVTTIELDPTVLEIAQFNPWSKELFDNPCIDQVIDGAFERITTLDANSFTCIIHDPPTFSLAGELYSTAFYIQAYRVLTPKGRMFHYIGDPNSKSGNRTTRGVVQRLKEAGFRRVVRRSEAFGVVAYK
ncbi:MAG: spermine synthase [Anaerolineales bacterium]|nr:spermine synthase [Anaerolineales bacterium]